MQRREYNLALLLSAVTVLLMGSGCQSDAARRVRVIRQDSLGVKLVTIMGDPSTLPSWTLATTPRTLISGTESGDSAALAPVGNVQWLPRGDLIIADQGAGRILVYDSSGTFRRALGGRGEGPAEFQGVGRISHAVGDTFAVFDAQRRRATFWHPDVGYVRGVQLAVGESETGWSETAWAIGDSSLDVLQMSLPPREDVAPSPGVRPWRTRAALVRVSGEGRVMRVGPPFDGMYSGLHEGGDTRLPFTNVPFAGASLGRAFFGSGNEFEIQWLNDASGLVEIVRWPGARELLEAEEVEALVSEISQVLLARMNAERIRERLKHSFVEEILPRHRPAIGRVLADDEGRLWIERFEPTRLGSEWQKPGIRWTVLGRDRIPVAVLMMPPDTRLEAVRGNRVAVVQRDSLHVEFVAVYEIKR